MQRNVKPGSFQYDDDEDYVPTKKVKYSFKDDNPIHNKKHTLDSDEEDEDTEEKAERKKYDVLKDEDIDGQEDATIDMEGETKITPFNMKEEMEEGHFDKDGFYHFSKDDDQLKDAWLDNIDWVKIKHKGDEIRKYGSDIESDSDEEKVPGEETRKEKEAMIAIYEEIFPFLKNGESIAKALKRLGGNTKRLSSAERWKLKKQGKLQSVANPGNMDEFMQLTELVHKIIELGNMDVYQETYEMINLKIQRFKASVNPSPAEPEMDMFSDEASSQKAKVNKEEKGNSTTKEKDTFDAVKWEYRWDNNDDAEIHGPFTTQQMIKWKDSNYFKNGVYVRKTSEQSGPWYLSSRLDFDLYV